jgi:hypothetical protein
VINDGVDHLANFSTGFSGAENGTMVVYAAQLRISNEWVLAQQSE